MIDNTPVYPAWQYEAAEAEIVRLNTTLRELAIASGEALGEVQALLAEREAELAEVHASYTADWAWFEWKVACLEDEGAWQEERNLNNVTAYTQEAQELRTKLAEREAELAVLACARSTEKEWATQVCKDCGSCPTCLARQWQAAKETHE